MIIPLRIVAVLLSAALLVFQSHASAEHRRPGEYEVKAAFIFNALPFVQWPVSAGGQAPQVLTMCVMGETLPNGVFRELHNQVMMGRKLEVIALAEIPRQGRCDVLFIGSSERRRVMSILEGQQRNAVFTIGDTDGYGKQGVIMNFYLEQNRVRFEINAAAARQAGITISAKLMRLAGAVHDR